MRLSWGGYNHDHGELGFTIRYKSLWDRFDRVIGSDAIWDIVGTKTDSTASGLTGKLTALEAAYNSYDGKDLIFYEDDGTTPTVHQLLAANCHGGIRVVHFDYPPGMPGIWGMKTEYVNKRTYRIRLKGTLHEAVTATDLFWWEESLRQIGTGGSRVKWMPAIIGPPQKQIVQLYTTYLVIQQGLAIGRTTWPIPPNPLAALAADELFDKREIHKMSPRDIRPYGSGTDYDLYGIRWKYVFETSIFGGGGPGLPIL